MILPEEKVIYVKMNKSKTEFSAYGRIGDTVFATRALKTKTKISDFKWYSDKKRVIQAIKNSLTYFEKYKIAPQNDPLLNENTKEDFIVNEYKIKWLH